MSGMDNNAKKNQKRTLRRVIFLFIFRVCIFSGLHIAYYAIHETKKKEYFWEASDVIAVSCCCWLAITLFLGIMEGGRILLGTRLNFWKRKMDPIPVEIDELRDNNNDTYDKSTINKRRTHSILLIPHTDWYVKKYRDVSFSRCMEVQGLCEDENVDKKKDQHDSVDFKLYVTPWALWYYVYACGISLFVFGYSITGLSMLSDVSAILSCVIVFPILFKTKHKENCAKVGSWFPIQILCTIGMSISLCMMAVGDAIHKHDVAIQWLSNNIWLGVFLPMICSSLLCKCSEQAKAMRLSPERVLMFAMPSLAMLSVTYLSFYLPTIIEEKCQQTQIDTAEVYNNLSKVIFSYNDSSKNHTTQESDFYLQFWSWSNSSQMQAMRTFFEARKGFDLFLLEDGSTLLTFFILISPLMLWATMVTIIGAASRGISNTQSALSGYTLVLTVKQYLLTVNPYWAIAAMVIIVPSCILSIAAEVYDDAEKKDCRCRRLKSINEEGEEEDDEDEIAVV